MNAHEKVRLAISRIKHSRPKVVGLDRKISYKSVGEEAGVAYQNLYKEGFEDLKREIDILKSVSERSERDKLLVKKRKKDIRVKELNIQLRELKSKLEKAARVNFNLNIENERLRKDLLILEDSKLHSFDRK